MTRTRWLIAGLWLLLFWLLAGTIWAPAVQRALSGQAAALLASQTDRLADLRVRFDGQHAVLTGNVRRDEDAREAADLIANRLRTGTSVGGGLGEGLNPVTGITAAIEVTPLPPGWVMLAANGLRASLFGIAANEFEARDVAQRIRDRWGEFGGRIEGSMTVDADRFDESAAAEQTLRIIPAPVMEGAASAQVHLARLGGVWQSLNLDASIDAQQREALALGISATDWQAHVSPAVQTVQRNLAAQRARAAEEARIAKLPPPHVFLAARDTRVILRGEVGTIASKRSLVEAALKAFPGWRILDDIRVNANRRPVNHFAPITLALLPQGQQIDEDKSLVLGIPGQAWQVVDWQVSRDAQPWLDTLPKDLPAQLLSEDSRMVIDWLQGGYQGIPTLPLKPQPAFLTLALLPDRVILAGQLAEESLRTQIIQSARQAYGAHAVIMADELLARGTCEPSADVFQSVRTFPPLPASGKPPVIAFARPGQVWKSVAVSAALLAPGALAKSGILPANFPAPMAEDTLSEAYQHLRAYLAKSTALPQPPADPGTLPLPTR